MSDEGRDLLLAHVALLKALKERNYQFITPTPLTHARVIARKQRAMDLRDVLGWSLPFERGVIDAEIIDLLAAAEALEEVDGLLKSTLRASSWTDFLFLHSAFPTTESNAVFFGPDSYRFASFLAEELPKLGTVGRLADIGTGAGIGIVAAMTTTWASEFAGTDINHVALDLGKANILFAASQANYLRSSPGNHGFGTLFVNTHGLDDLDGPFHAIIGNAPYLVDAGRRAYRDGGGAFGAEVSLSWARAAAEKLALGGTLLLYTGCAIIGGEDRFNIALHEMLPGFEIRYRELDPDVFGEELEREEYADVERIAVVGVVATKR